MALFRRSLKLPVGGMDGIWTRPGRATSEHGKLALRVIGSMEESQEMMEIRVMCCGFAPRNDAFILGYEKLLPSPISRGFVLGLESDGVDLATKKCNRSRAEGLGIG